MLERRRQWMRLRTSETASAFLQRRRPVRLSTPSRRQVSLSPSLFSLSVFLRSVRRAAETFIPSFSLPFLTFSFPFSRCAPPLFYSRYRGAPPRADGSSPSCRAAVFALARSARRSMFSGISLGRSGASTALSRLKRAIFASANIRRISTGFFAKKTFFSRILDCLTNMSASDVTCNF